MMTKKRVREITTYFAASMKSYYEKIVRKIRDHDKEIYLGHLINSTQF